MKFRCDEQLHYKPRINPKNYAIHFLNNFKDLYTTIYQQLGHQSGHAVEDLIKSLWPHASLDLNQKVSLPIALYKAQDIKLTKDLLYAAYRNSEEEIISVNYLTNRLVGRYFAIDPDKQDFFKILAFAIAPNSSTLAWIDNDDYLYGADILQGVLLFKSKIDQEGSVEKIVFSSDSKKIMFAKDNGTYGFYTIENNFLQDSPDIKVPPAYKPQQLINILFSLQGTYYALITHKCAYIGNSNVPDNSTVLKIASAAGLCFSPTQDSTVAYQDTSDSIVIKNLSTGTILNSFTLDNDKKENCTALTFNNDATKLILLGNKGTLWIKNLITQHVSKNSINNYSSNEIPDVFFDASNDLILLFTKSRFLYYIEVEKLDFTFDCSSILKLALALSDKSAQDSKDLEAYNKKVKEIKALLRDYQNQNYDEPPAKKRKTSDKS